MTDTSGGIGPHLDDEALSAAVDAQAIAAEQAHLSSCPRCQARMAQIEAVARAVGAPVPPRAAADVTGAIDRALASWDAASMASTPPSDRPVTLKAVTEPGLTAVPDPGRTAGRGPGTYRGTAPGGPAGRRVQHRWAGAVAAMAAAVVVVLGLVAVTRGQRHSSSTAATSQLPTASELAPGSTAAPGSADRAAGLAPTVSGGDLGDQSDPATVASAVTSRLARPDAAATGGKFPSPSTTAPNRNPSPAFNAPAAAPACASEAATAAGLAPGQSVVPRLVASLRWRGQQAVAFVYDTPHGLSGVIMRTADCAPLAVIPL